MAYERVTKPISGYEAFGQVGDAAILSQAAFVLILGNQLRGTPQARAARTRAVGITATEELLPSEDQAVFPLPTIPATAERFSPDKLRAAANRAAGMQDYRARYRASASDAEAARVAYGALARGVYETPTSESAATLLNECIFHDHELVRTAAAAAYCTHAADPRPLIDLLAKATRSKDTLTRDVGATALAISFIVYAKNRDFGRLFEFRNNSGETGGGETGLNGKAKACACAVLATKSLHGLYGIKAL